MLTNLLIYILDDAYLIKGLSGLDVLGYSHQGAAQFEAAHNASPTTPLVLSECCSCQSQRAGSSRPGSARSVDSECIAVANSPGLLPYVSGSLGVWTGYDHFLTDEYPPHPDDVGYQKDGLSTLAGRGGDYN